MWRAAESCKIADSRGLLTLQKDHRVTTSLLPTLSDYPEVWARCSACGVELPKSAPVERFKNNWLVIQCPQCQRCTPYRLEEKQSHA